MAIGLRFLDRARGGSQHYGGHSIDNTFSPRLPLCSSISSLWSSWQPLHTHSWLCGVYRRCNFGLCHLACHGKRLEHWPWKSGTHRCRDYYIQRNAQDWGSGWDIGTIPFLCTIQTEQEARECVGDLPKTMLLALILNQCNRNPFGFDCFINQACLVWWDHLHVPFFPSTLLNICPLSMAQVAR